MDALTIVFVLSLLGFFFTHCLYFFNLNWQSRITVYFVNLFTLWLYLIYLGYYFLSSRIYPFADPHQHLLLLGGVLLFIFTVSDFFLGAKSLGLIFSIIILLFSTTGLIQIQRQETIHTLSNFRHFHNMILFVDQLAVVFFFLSIIFSLIYHYSFIEVKYHHRFFFSNRFPNLDRLWRYIDICLLAGALFTSSSIFFSLEFGNNLVLKDLYSKMIGCITVGYYLILWYIRYRRWFSSKLNLYWMLLSILFLLTKVGYWL